MATPAAPVPLVIVGGYLGAGKTTLVNHLLRHAGGRRIAVLVNDFGSVSIDASLIVGSADGVLALAGGCVCCAYGADLIGTLTTAVQREPTPDVVLVECSGVGLPAAVARTAALAPGVAIDGIAVVIDAVEVPQQWRDRFVGDTVQQQLRQADLLVVNQVDRLDEGAEGSLRELLQAHAPAVPQLRCSRGEVPVEALLGLRVAREAQAEVLGASEGPRDTAWLGGGGAWRGPSAGAERHFRFEERRFEGCVDAQALARELASPASGLLRAKGVVTGLDGRPWVIQVMGRRHEAQPLMGAADDAGGRIVCIRLL